jgi:hypothetical protein
MAGNNDKNKKGFSGLSDLASDVSDVDEPIKLESKTEDKPSTSGHQAASRSVSDNHRASRPRYPGTSPITEEETEGRKRQQPAGFSGWIVFLGIIGLIAGLYWVGESSRTSTTGYSSPDKNSSYQSSGYSATSSVPKQPTALQGRADPLDKQGICELQELLSEMGLYKSTVDGISGPGTKRAIVALLSDYPSASKYGPSTRVLQYARSEVSRLRHSASATTAKVSPPQNGHIFNRRSYGKAPFKISTSSGENYYVKLVDQVTGSEAMTFFVRGGQSVELDVPYGTYSLKYASGRTWYSTACLFGRNTTFFEADRTLRFYVNGYQVVGHRVELIRQVNGNMDSRSIPAGRF